MGGQEKGSQGDRPADGMAGSASPGNGRLTAEQETALAELYVRQRFAGRMQEAAGFVKNHARAFAQAYLREHQLELSLFYLASQYARRHALDQSYVDRYAGELAQNYVLEHPLELAQRYLLDHQMQQPASYLEENQIALAQSYIDEHRLELAERCVADFGVERLSARVGGDAQQDGGAGPAAEGPAAAAPENQPAFDLSELAGLTFAGAAGPPLSGRYAVPAAEKRFAWEGMPPVPLSGDGSGSGLAAGYRAGAPGRGAGKTLAGAVPPACMPWAESAGAEVTSAWF